ncbi:hypothetical protein [Desulfitobacterium sp.]|uniref:hypothetical protein n=1 Tax=Desulfitobacterium sp. TaxID=49981 RepID=UPI002B1EF477|nr:hypothetical protein [Desulfitobacterium sp.]MEA4900530.1 hypothetical protein [Desulfitobacterium sp.]
MGRTASDNSELPTLPLARHLLNGEEFSKCRANPYGPATLVIHGTLSRIGISE